MASHIAGSSSKLDLGVHAPAKDGSVTLELSVIVGGTKEVIKRITLTPQLHDYLSPTGDTLACEKQEYELIKSEVKDTEWADATPRLLESQAEAARLVARDNKDLTKCFLDNTRWCSSAARRSCWPFA